MPKVFEWRGYRLHNYAHEGDPREPPHIHIRKDGSDARFWLRPFTFLTIFLTLAACAAQTPETVSTAPQTPGFWWGLWHGFIFPWAFIGSLFSDTIAVYAVPNSGGWYDAGFFIGITVLGGGSFFGSKKRRGEG